MSYIHDYMDNILLFINYINIYIDISSRQPMISCEAILCAV